MNDLDFTYDRMNRLKEETSVFDLDYTYDALGNRTQQTENTVTTNYTYSNMMRLTSKTVAGQATDFTYDLNGNLIEKEEGNSSYTYTWDINNRLREVRDDGNLLFEYLYDSQGRRVKSHNHSTGVTTTYIYAGINVIYEETSSESTDYLYANGMRIAKKTGSTVKYFHPDHLGSTRLVTDSSGQPTFESDYKPFGEDANATGTEKYAFTGQYSEADIGLYYFGARWYDASLGRFISEDPLKGSMTSSQSQNPYVYCMNNPLRYIDPSGMMGDIPDDPYQTYGHLTAAELVYGIREDPTIFDDIIDDYNTWYDYWHGEPLFNDTSIDPYNLNPVSSNRQNPIGGHGYISAPLVSANGYGLYDSKTKDWDARVHINLFGGMSTPGAGATLIDLDVSIDEFNSIKKTVSGTIEIPIAETGANLVIDRAYYDKVVDGTTTTHRLYSGIGIGYGKKGIPGGGISTSSGLNLIFGTESEGGFYWVVSWD